MGKPVSEANCRASVDFPEPGLPKIATRCIDGERYPLGFINLLRYIAWLMKAIHSRNRTNVIF